MLTVNLTLICAIPANRMVNVEHVKYLKARSNPSLSNVKWVSNGSLTAAHIRSVMFRLPANLKSWSDNLHMYLKYKATYIAMIAEQIFIFNKISTENQKLPGEIKCLLKNVILKKHICYVG